MIARFLIVLLLLYPGSKAFAVEHYDYPDNNKLSPSSFPTTKIISLLDSRYRGVSGRLLLWSDYKGIKNNKDSISSNRWVRETIKVSCRPKPDGTRGYFYIANDAETGAILTTPVIQYSREVEQPLC